jgi:hypothetical protein
MVATGLMDRAQRRVGFRRLGQHGGGCGHRRRGRRPNPLGPAGGVVQTLILIRQGSGVMLTFGGRFD